jgi:serine/threonine protein kinase
MAERPPDPRDREVDPRADVTPGALASGIRALLSNDPSGRYQVEGEVARGGQGAILRVWDGQLHRHLAMKVSLGQLPAADLAAALASGAATPSIDARRLGRFLEEAQITGQLDHPGIVPVHELGLDDQGRVFFTMKLVKGEDLSTVFARVQAGEPGWTTTRVVSILLRACEALSYAHSKRVIHRDLKPANVMVGRYGEVFVMDWGLSRLLDRPDPKDIRLRPQAEALTSEVRSARREAAAASPDLPLFTMDGDVMGTPAYMSPEQASGHLDRMGPPSDVYSVGAMLYQLLSGRMPYTTPGARVHNYAVLSRVQEGPPVSLRQPGAAGGARAGRHLREGHGPRAGDRYPDMATLADDLRAWLERRVVSAYETGAWAELRKWVARNTPLATAIAAGVLLLAGGLTVSLVFKARSDRNGPPRGGERDTGHERGQ